MKTTLEVLVCARTKIEKSENWTQCGHYAVGVHNEIRRPDSKSAEAFCAVGAIQACTGGDGDTLARNALIDELPADEYEGIAGFNDRATTKHADILALYDRAIERVA